MEQKGKKMKYIKSIIITSIIFATALAMTDEYKAGFKVGYKTGYCGKPQNCYVYPPYAPYPNYGEDTYEGGFVKGYYMGLADRP
jgi:hypothetical protein